MTNNNLQLLGPPGCKLAKRASMQTHRDVRSNARRDSLRMRLGCSPRHTFVKPIAMVSLVSVVATEASPSFQRVKTPPSTVLSQAPPGIAREQSWSRCHAPPVKRPLSRYTDLSFIRKKRPNPNARAEDFPSREAFGRELAQRDPPESRIGADPPQFFVNKHIFHAGMNNFSNVTSNSEKRPVQGARTLVSFGRTWVPIPSHWPLAAGGRRNQNQGR